MDEGTEVTTSDSIKFNTQDPVCPPAPKLRPIDMTESFQKIPAHSRSGIIDNTQILTTLIGILIEKRTSTILTAPIELNYPPSHQTVSRHSP